MTYSVNDPAVVTRPILFPAFSVNQSALSGPRAIPRGPLLAVGIVNSLVTTPVGVIRPILLGLFSVTHRAPSESGPAAMPQGRLLPVGALNSVMAPAVVIRPILLRLLSVNQSA